VSEGEQGTAVAPEPVAPATQGGEGTAPSQEQSGEGAVEIPQEGKQPERGIPTGAYRELKGLRQRTREQERRIAELETRLTQHSPASNGKEVDPKSIWDDPERYVETKFQTLQQRAEIARGKQDAYKFIQSQDDVRTEEDEDEIAELMEESGLVAALDRNPKRAVEIALMLWRQSKGINPAADAAKNLQLTKNQAKAVVGAPAAGGKKLYSRAEIDQLSSNPEKWAEVREDVMLAQKEGRIRP
jgi:hypothetical protein